MKLCQYPDPYCITNELLSELDTLPWSLAHGVPWSDLNLLALMLVDTTTMLEPLAS